jgi:hypothetical protein
MKIISFAHTTPALLAGAKTVTRRDWKPRTAASYSVGEIVQAWDKNPRIGGRKVAEIRLTQAPYLESTADAPDADYAAEGFAYMQGRNLLIDSVAPITFWRLWHTDPQDLYVVRFELVPAGTEPEPEPEPQQAFEL